MEGPGKLNYAVASLLICGLILVVGHFLQFDFAAIVLVGMLLGRKLGWWLSKTALYKMPLPFTLILCIGWGVLFGFALQGLIREFNPGTITKVFAYGAAAYVSVPNFGLLAKASIPVPVQHRDLLIQVVPFVTFAIVSALLAFI